MKYRPRGVREDFINDLGEIVQIKGMQRITIRTELIRIKDQLDISLRFRT